MSNALATVHHSLTMWEDDTKVQEVRKLFAPSLTDLEFGFFVGMGKATNLNPFLREIWAVKYDKSQAAQIFIGRDGYRKAAQGHPEYDFHQSDAVYENDKFEVINGDVKHSYKLTNRGKLIGAYCIAKRHKSSRPIYVFAELGEYSTGRSLWDAAKGKPATMIKKVAESQCLRACFQDLLGGTYGEEEMIERSSRQSLKEGNPSKSNQLMDKLKQAKGQTIDVEPEAEQETGEIATTDQLKEVHALLAVKDFNKDRLTGALGHYNVETLAQLTAQQADDFINQLNKIADK